MNIFLENVNLNSSSGPNSFAQKLTPRLQAKGHALTDLKTADVALCFIESHNPHFGFGCPRILRLDGIYFNSAQDFLFQNRNIRRTYENSQAIVFQSNFNKELITRYFGDHPNTTVIHNGADKESIKEALPVKFGAYESQYDNIWCAASSWRPHKRLDENIRYFLEHKGDKDLLVIAGDVAEKFQHPDIVYYGNLTQKQLYCLYVSSKYFLHLAYLDHCPNVVVDARASGCQVICSSTGGTKEIAGPDAIVIDEEKWNWEPTKLYEPPKMDFNRKIENKWDIDIDMDFVAKKYESFLKDTCR
jgi:glycosyltransferase involved in cell wall biosynthesis